MLGSLIRDPGGVEGEAGESPGLGLLDMTTTLQPQKQLRQVAGVIVPWQEPVEGYEIHCGHSEGTALEVPFARLPAGPDGAVSGDGQVIGSYIHGLFDHPGAAASLLRWAGLEQSQSTDYRALRESQIERLADCIEQHLDMAALYPVPVPEGETSP